MGEQAVSATVKLSRDPHIPTKLAAAQATGSLLKAELDGHLPDGCAMEPLVPVLVALLGRDQNSEVQRQGLLVSSLILALVLVMILDLCRFPCLCYLSWCWRHSCTGPARPGISLTNLKHC